MSEEEKKKEELSSLAVSPIAVESYQVAMAVEDILAERVRIPSAFFKNINTSEEFGIERFILDRIYHLPSLIEEIELSHLGGTKYVVQAEKRDSGGHSIRFEHRLQATSHEEAERLFDNIAMRQSGIWQKIWLACWLLGNKVGQFVYTCSLTELMHTAYPQREGYFSVGEKIEFYEHLKSLEQTRFVFSKKLNKKNRAKKQTLSYNIPLIAITQEIRTEEKYPEKLTISLRAFEPTTTQEKIFYVGAAIKNKTLELHADDTQLAGWLQTRKGQRQDEDFISLNRNFLIKLAGLQRTDISNRTVANKKLLLKLKRLEESQIITETPTSITEIIRLRVR